jgi:hypothetical protein
MVTRLLVRQAERMLAEGPGSMLRSAFLGFGVLAMCGIVVFFVLFNISHLSRMSETPLS